MNNCKKRNGNSPSMCYEKGRKHIVNILIKKKVDSIRGTGSCRVKLLAIKSFALTLGCPLQHISFS